MPVVEHTKLHNFVRFKRIFNRIIGLAATAICLKFRQIVCAKLSTTVRVQVAPRESPDAPNSSSVQRHPQSLRVRLARRRQSETPITERSENSHNVRVSPLCPQFVPTLPPQRCTVEGRMYIGFHRFAPTAPTVFENRAPRKRLHHVLQAARLGS